MGEPTLDEITKAIDHALNYTARRRWPTRPWSKTPSHYVLLAATEVHELIAGRSGSPATEEGPTDG